MTAVLGNMVPPNNGGSDAVDRLTDKLTELVNAITGIAKGSSSGSGGGGKPPKDPTKQMNKQWDSFSSKIEKEFAVFSTVGKTSAGTVARLRFEFDKLNKAFVAAAQQSKVGTDIWVNLRKLEKTSSSQSAAKMGPVDKTKEQADALSKLRRYLMDLVADGGKLNYKHARRLEDLGGTKEAAAVRNLVAKTKQKEAADEKQAAIDDRVKRQQSFYDKMSRRAGRGLGFTEGHLSRAQDLNMPGLARQIAAKIDQSSQAAKDKATKKRVEDFEILQHNTQVDNDRRAKAKADREAAKANAPAKQGGSFFGGFTRNMVIGRLYAAANAALAPLEAFGAGIGVHWLKAWKSLTEAAYSAGKALSLASGMGESAARFENIVNTFTERLNKSNALQELARDPAGRIGAGFARSSASLAGGAAGALGGAMDNPLTGLNAIVDKIGHAVGLADPGTMSRYNMVLRDLTATIGQGLSPVVSVITKILKEFGDYLQPLVQAWLPEIKKTLNELYLAIKPLIPLFIVELQQTINEVIAKIKELGGNNGAGFREMIANSLKAADGLSKFITMLGYAAGALADFANNPIGFIAKGAVVAGGGAAALMGAKGKGGGGNAMLAAAAGLQKGNIAGAAVAQNATIGSGSDLARKASQEAFIASSAKGNIDPAQNLFQQAAQQAIQFFQNAMKPAPAANGKAQPGIAAGAPQGGWLDAMANIMPGGQAAVKGLRLMGM